MRKEVDEDDILPCSKCRAIPRFYEVTGLWYIQCPGRCDRMEVGVTKRRVIDNWNKLNEKSAQYTNSDLRRVKVCEEEYRGVGKGEPIYQLSSTGKTVKTFKSCRHLANFLGISRNSVIGKFYYSESGYVTIKGTMYFREPKKCKE